MLWLIACHWISNALINAHANHWIVCSKLDYLQTTSYIAGLLLKQQINFSPTLDNISLSRIIKKRHMFCNKTCLMSLVLTFKVNLVISLQPNKVQNIYHCWQLLATEISELVMVGDTFMKQVSYNHFNTIMFLNMHLHQQSICPFIYKSSACSLC